MSSNRAERRQILAIARRGHGLDDAIPGLEIGRHPEGGTKATLGRRRHDRRRKAKAARAARRKGKR